jgi:hypothetical protein
MQNVVELVGVPDGARFFDEKKRDLGWATKVFKRDPSLGGLTVLDVTTAEPALALFLRSLDKGRLFVHSTDSVRISASRVCLRANSGLHFFLRFFAPHLFA